MDNHRDRCGRSGLCLIMCGKRDMSYHDSSSWLFIVFRFIQRHIIRVAFRWIMFLLTGKTELERVVSCCFVNFCCFSFFFVDFRARDEGERWNTFILVSVEED
uniref:Transmembrane protein n=1 Tax=Ascaris lumbricoides TaxID=6252 RepID=A0A0M3ITL0_ASCLU